MFRLLIVLSSLFAFATYANENDHAYSQDIESLQERIDRLERQINAGQVRASTFNPGITVFGNMLGCVGASTTPPKAEPTDHAHDEHSHDDHDHEHGAHDHAHEHSHNEVDSSAPPFPPCGNRFWLREVEVDLRASIDPWADGVVILAFEQHNPGDFHFEIEEGYLQLKRLPILNASPMGLSVKAGRFLVGFGRINTIHTHDLPQVTRPFVHQTFLSGHGLMRNGASAQIMIPTPGNYNALQATMQIVGGGGLPFDPILTGSWPAFIARLNWFVDVADGHNIEAGTSAYIEPRDGDKYPLQLYGFDVNYQWKPFIAGQWRSILLGSEVMFASGYTRISEVQPMGVHAWSQYQFNINTYASLRYDYTQGAYKDALYTHSMGVFLTYYTTEFLRLRMGYEHNVNDIATFKGRDNFLFEINFVFGSHPAEPYWVNR